MFRSLNRPLACVFLVLATLVVPVHAAPPPASGDDRVVEQYLQRLGLADLRLHQLERTFAKAKSPTERTVAAKRLADAYLDRLISAADEPEVASELESRVRDLVAKAPEVNSAELKLLLMQGEYQRAEHDMQEWLRSARSRPVADSTLKALQDLAKRFAEQHETLAAEIDRLSQSLDGAQPSGKLAIEQRAIEKQARCVL
jgi:hypothetical protein